LNCADVLNWLALDFSDYIALQNASLICWTTAFNVHHNQTHVRFGRNLQAHALRQLDRLHRDPEVGTGDVPLFEQLTHHALD
jgi:hypothetical protein